MNRMSLLSCRGLRNTIMNIIFLRMIVKDFQQLQGQDELSLFMVSAERAPRGAEQLKTATENNSPNPNVALEGQCVVVCDAAVVGLDLEKMKYSDNQEAGSSDNVAVKTTANGDLKGGVVPSRNDALWNKIKNQETKSDLFSLGKRARNIAFSVTRSSAHAPSNSGLKDKAVVSFDYVMVNVGNAFDLQSSSFVVPISGVYSLAFQVYKLYSRQSLTINLTVNKIPILFGFANGENGNYETVQNSGLLHLAFQDRVELRVVSGNLDSGWKYSTFSGFLLFQDEDY